MDAALHGAGVTAVTALGQPGKRSGDKLARIPVKIVPLAAGEVLAKPPWLHARPMMSETVAGMAASCVNIACIRCVRRPCVRTSANVLRSAPRRS